MIMISKSSQLDGKNVYLMGIDTVKIINDVLQFFQDGEDGKSHKMSPGRMREMLIVKCYDRLDFTSEAEPRKAISKCVI